MRSLHGRRKILRLTREVSAKRGSDNVLTTGVFVVCETQNFASHKGGKCKEG